MSINDVYNFAEKNNYKLNNDEANIIYNTIKNNWEEIIFGDHKKILDNININKDLYEKLNTLINEYKTKYSELLKKDN